MIGVVLIAAAACSGGSDGAGDGEAADPTVAAVDPAELAELGLDGPVDEVIRMQPGTPGRPPEFLTAGSTVLSARRLLQAPGGERGPVDLWVMRIKDPGGAVMACRFVTDHSGSGGGSCGDVLQDAAAGNGDGSVQIGASSDGAEVVYDLGGPDDLTHYIITLDGRRLAVIPVEGDAIVRLDDGCGAAGGTLTAWRGDVQVDEQVLTPPC